MMDQKLKNAINNYLKPKGFTSIIQKVLYQFSEYKITVKGDKNSDILIFINNEFKIRNDHYHQIERIYDSLKEIGVSVKFVIARRVFNIFSNQSFLKQFQNVYSELEHNYKKVLVFCDSVPLQNYIVNKFNQLNIDTYSLQHGFYLEDTNEVFLDVYKSSNSKNFFVWDERTLKYMKKHYPNRNYIKVGPHYSINLKNKSKIIVNKIAIFGCGKDQKSENAYLSKIYKLLILNGYDAVFISHPKFHLIDRIQFYIWNNVWINKNKAKLNSFKLSIVLNSSVYLELKENEDPYFLVNNHFERKILPTVNELFSTKKSQSKLLKPFLTKEKSLETIIKNLVYDL